MKSILWAALALFCLAGTAGAQTPPTAEVLHWWTAGGEAKALRVIADRFQAEGGRWIDNPVAGGGGDAARTVAKTRLVGGKPPTMMQWHLGLSLKQLAEEGLLGDVDEVAKEGGWDAALPALIADNARYKGHYVAIPVGIHGENWLWTNPKVLADAGVSVPKTWAEFDAAAAKLKAAGVIPLALGGQGWQQVIVFNAVVLGTQGPGFYRKALVDLDAKALGGPEMVAVFEQLARIKGFIDPGATNRDWNEATQLVIKGRAAMQLMGDFAAAGLQPEKDYGCDASPGAGQAYLVAADALAVPKLSDPAQRRGQLLMAKIAMDPKVQRDFSLAKGSVPARRDVPADGFDACSLKAMEKVRNSPDILPALGSSMGVGAAEAGAITDAVAQFFASSMSPTQGARTLRDAIDAIR